MKKYQTLGSLYFYVVYSRSTFKTQTNVQIENKLYYYA